MINMENLQTISSLPHTQKTAESYNINRTTDEKGGARRSIQITSTIVVNCISTTVICYIKVQHFSDAPSNEQVREDLHNKKVAVSVISFRHAKWCSSASQKPRSSFLSPTHSCSMSCSLFRSVSGVMRTNILEH